jgi:hypothetical protein
MLRCGFALSVSLTTTRKETAMSNIKLKKDGMVELAHVRDFFDMTSQEMLKEWKELDKDERDWFRKKVTEVLVG